MEKELADLKLKLAHVMARDAGEPKVVFTPRERKISNLSGKRDSDVTVDEFIEDIELTLKTRPTSDIEKVFHHQPFGGSSKRRSTLQVDSRKKEAKRYFNILREVFGDRGTISELLSDFYQCKQEDETLQEYCHKLMCKLDRVCKRDQKVITDRDMTLRNQLAENVKEVWLRRELKKRIRSTPSITFSDIREEVTLLVEDSKDTAAATTNDYEYEVPVLATQSVPKTTETTDLSKLLLDLKSEMKNMREEMELLKGQNKSQKTGNARQCYYCGKPGHMKRECRKRQRDSEVSANTQDLNGSGLRLRADL